MVLYLFMLHLLNRNQEAPALESRKYQETDTILGTAGPHSITQLLNSEYIFVCLSL